MTHEIPVRLLRIGAAAGRSALAVTLVAFFLFTGCSAQSQRIRSQQSELEKVSRELRFMKEQNAQLKREIDRLARQIEGLEAATKKDRADLEARLQAALQRFEQVQNQLQDTNARLSDTQPLQSDFNAALDPTPASQPAAVDTAGGSAVLSSSGERELYNTAYRDLVRGNFQLALHGFREYMRLYPRSELTDNAQYWIGEVFYAQGRYPAAVDEFEKVTKWHRNGDKVASALLKIAYAYINMDEIEQGKLYLDEVIKNHPDSEEANLARGRLATME